MTPSTEEALEKVRLGYIAKIPSRIEELKALAGAVISPADRRPLRSAVERLSAVAHRLAGSGATFGFPGISENARELEFQCEEFLHGKPEVISALTKSAEGLIEAMIEAVIEAGGSAGDLAKPGIAPPPSRSASYRVLVVDDEESIAAYTKAILEAAGMEVRAETDPQQVLEVLADFKPQLVLLDLQMPGLSGQDLAAVIGGQETGRRIPIIFLTGEEDTGKRRQAEGLGERFLPKPVDRNTLIEAVCEAIEKNLR